MSQNQFVIPGDVIITGSYTPEQNVILDGEKIMSTAMIQTIEASTNATITIGQNGLIVLKCDDITGLKKAVKSIKMMDKALHNTNLEERIQNILDEKN
jgi:exosome complex RNA-binding protein Rrp4